MQKHTCPDCGKPSKNKGEFCEACKLPKYKNGMLYDLSNPMCNSDNVTLSTMVLSRAYEDAEEGQADAMLYLLDIAAYYGTLDDYAAMVRKMGKMLKRRKMGNGVSVSGGLLPNLSQAGRNRLIANLTAMMDKEIKQFTGE
jgi:hypothetical protein